VNRPAVSVVMPFAGTAADAQAAVSSLLRLELRAGDELIVADNSATVPATPGVTVVPALAERSPAHARNAGAERAGNEFILFLDADCLPPPNLLDLHFADPVDAGVGALAGEVIPAAGDGSLASRYATARSFLGQEAHLAHPYKPRAVAANLMVRRAAFDQLGGFFEGLRAAEDTDFCWRLQEAGWRLELRVGARVEHRYRATLAELRRQWRGYAAGRAWLARRYQGFEPRPAVWRALRRAAPGGGPPRGAPATDAGRSERAGFLALDVLLALDELVGFGQSNRPSRDLIERVPAEGVLVAERFPAPGDPMVAFARTVARARVEAAGRPDVVDRQALRALWVAYREDDGVAERAYALVRLLAREPVRGALDLLRRRAEQPALSALAPAALRLARESGAPVQPLGGEDADATAVRLAALTGTALAPPGRP